MNTQQQTLYFEHGKSEKLPVHNNWKFDWPSNNHKPKKRTVHVVQGR